MKDFWAYVRSLKKNFPLRKCFKIKIRTKPYKKLFSGGFRCHGYCTYSEKNNVFTLYIERNQDISTMINILIHEWAHALTWHVANGFHCRKFWQMYAKIYNFYEDDE